MIGRFWWSSVLTLTAAMCLMVAAPNAAKAADITVDGPNGRIQYDPLATPRRPGLIDPSCGLVVGGFAVASSSCDSQYGREWEGLSATDFFTFQTSVYAAPDPDIAVGPDDILTIVNRQIVRYPNPNAPSGTNANGTASVAYDGNVQGLFSPTSRQFLDGWLGTVALTELCPTTPRSNLSCQIENASVRYDQMQGRFLVLFTVIDTGLVHCNGCVASPSQGTGTIAFRRKASWVLISSRWALGCGGASGVTAINIGSTCTPNTLPATPGIPGNTTFFTTPQPPGTSAAINTGNAGGINTNWVMSYGTPDGSCDSVCLFGNVNSISDLRRGGVFAGARIIDCNNTAVGDSARVCYFPSSARLGLDNDNIVISSSVYNDNIPLPTRGFTLQANGLVPAWEGTRTRVLKKSAVYTGISSTPGCASTMCPGASQLNPQLQGDFYDLFTVATPYTFDALVLRTLPTGIDQSMTGLNYEPEHVRGRSLASYNGNANVGPCDGGSPPVATCNGISTGVPVPVASPGTQPLGTQFSALWGTVDQGFIGAIPQTLLYHRAITYTRTINGTLGTNVGNTPAVVNQPLIVGGIPTLGDIQSHTVPGFISPNSIVQRDKLDQTTQNNDGLPTPWLYVGDDRPHRVISREGHRYIARVGNSSGVGFPAGGLEANRATVIYDIVQKLNPGTAAFEIYNTSWGNGSFYAPMFDTPANVVQYGSISPINVQPFLEKLFVGTVFPALSPMDSRTFSYSSMAGTALAACKGLNPGVGSPLTGNTTSVRAYPALFDIRCGEDAYDTALALRHPVTGAFTPGDFRIDLQPSGFPSQLVPFGIRGGAATDPNNLGLWLYGAYAKGRVSSVNGFGSWGTYVAHYPLTFPLRDPYNNSVGAYSDVPPGHPFFTYIQTAKQTEIDPGSRTAATFGLNDLVLRKTMALWTLRAQMDENAITAYLNSTGGIFCSFADVLCPGVSGPVTNTTGGASAGYWRYIEAMYRRGYTKGCSDSNDGQRRFCPDRTLTRGEMSVFVIRAKMNSVFPTVTSGTFTTALCSPGAFPGTPFLGQPTQVTQVGDQFGLFVGCTQYFSDVPTNHPYFAFIQKMRELRITNGTSFPTTVAPAASNATFSPDNTLTKGELMTFLVRAFFP